MRFSQEILDLVCGEFACRGSEFEDGCDKESDLTSKPLVFSSARKELATNVAVVSKAFNAAAKRVVWEWVIIRLKEDLLNIAEFGSVMYGDRTKRLDVAIDFRGKKHADGSYERKKLVDVIGNMPHLRVLVLDNTFDPPPHPWKVIPLSAQVIDGVLRCRSMVRLELLSTTEPLQVFDFMRIAHECPGLKTLVIGGSTGVACERRLRPPSGYQPPSGTNVLPALERLCMGKPWAKFMPQLVPHLCEDGSPRLPALRRLDMRYTSQMTECEGWRRFMESNGPHLHTLEWVVGPCLPRSWLNHLTNLHTLILTLRRDDASGWRVHGWPKPDVEAMIVQPQEAFVVPEDTHETWIGLLQTVSQRRGPRLKEIRVERVDWVVNEQLGAKISSEVGEGMKGGQVALWFGGKAME